MKSLAKSLPRLDGGGEDVQGVKGEASAELRGLWGYWGNGLGPIE